MQNLKKYLKIASVAAAIVAFVVFVVMMFTPVINIHVEGSTDHEFDFANGQDFVGWQVIFYYWGPNIPIGDRAAFRPNIPLCVFSVVFLITFIVCLLNIKNANGVKCLVYEAIMAVVFVAGAVLLFNILTLLESSVGNLVADTLFLAQKSGGYTMQPMTIVTAITMLVAAVIKIADGVVNVIASGKQA